MLRERRQRESDLRKGVLGDAHDERYIEETTGALCVAKREACAT